MGDETTAPEAEGTDEHPQLETELSRNLSLFAITFIGIGAMIGAGVFALTGFAAGIAGPGLMLAFLLNGGIAGLTAMSYAELGAAFPQAGGAYNWVTEALPSPFGFYTGWINWFAQAVACALYAVTFGVFLTEFIIVFTALPRDFVLWGFLTRGLLDRLLAAVMVGVFGYINFRGAEETGKAGILVTSLKIVILAIFVVFGGLATFRDPTWPTKFFGGSGFLPHGIAGILGAMGFTYVAFEGYDIIVQSGEEVIDPKRNIPRAIFLSLAVVIPIYILVAFAAIGGIDVTQALVQLAGMTGTPETWQILGQLGERGIIQAAGQFVPYGTPLLLVAGLAATMSALNATLYSSSRIAFSMGRDRILPESLRSIHPRTRTPHLAIWVSALGIALMAVTLPIESVAASTSVAFILLFSMVNVAVISMRKRRPDLERTFKIPLMPWIPIAGIVLQLLLVPFMLFQLGLSPGQDGFTALVTTALWVGIGVVVYLGYSERQEKERLEEAAPTVVTERAPAAPRPTLLVPLANPENAEQLMRTALDVARDRDLEVLVMSVVTVAPQTPLGEGRKFVEGHREVLRHAMSLAEGTDVPVSGTIRIGHSVAQVILNTVEQHEVKALLLGWKGRPRRRDIILGSNVDEVVKKARCDVLIERIADHQRIGSILLPTAGGPHAEYAAEVAATIARSNGAPVEVVSVVTGGLSEEARETAERTLQRTRTVIEETDGVEVTTRILEGTNVADAIVEASKEHDLTIIGATREGLLQQLILGAIPEDVGRRASGTVLMAKRYLGITGTVTRWLRWRRR